MTLEEIKQKFQELNGNYLSLGDIDDVDQRITALDELLDCIQRLGLAIAPLKSSLELELFHQLHTRYIQDLARVQTSLADTYLQKGSQETEVFEDYRDHGSRTAALRCLEQARYLLTQKKLGGNLLCGVEIVSGKDRRTLVSRSISLEYDVGSALPVKSVIQLAAEAIGYYAAAIAADPSKGSPYLKSIQENLSGLMEQINVLTLSLQNDMPVSLNEFQQLYDMNRARAITPENFVGFLKVYKDRYNHIVNCFILALRVKKLKIEIPGTFTTECLFELSQIIGFIEPALKDNVKALNPLRDYEAILEGLHDSMRKVGLETIAPLTTQFYENYCLSRKRIKDRIRELSSFASGSVHGAVALAEKYKMHDYELVLMVFPLLVDSYQLDKEKYNDWLFETLQLFDDKMIFDRNHHQPSSGEVALVSSIAKICTYLFEFSREDKLVRLLSGDVHWRDKIQLASAFINQFPTKNACLDFEKKSEDDHFFKCLVSFMQLFVELCHAVADQIHALDRNDYPAEIMDEFFRFYKITLDIAIRIINGGFVGSKKKQLTLKNKVKGYVRMIPDVGASSSVALEPAPRSYFFHNPFPDRVLRVSLWRTVSMYLDHFYAAWQLIDDLDNPDSVSVFEVLNPRYEKAYAAIEDVYDQYASEYAAKTDGHWHQFLNAVNSQLWQMTEHCKDLCDSFSLVYRHVDELDMASVESSASPSCMAGPSA